MNKKFLIAGLLILTGILLPACETYEHKDVLPICQEAYDNALIEYPDLPRGYIGFCVSYLQTGDIKAAQALCTSEAVREEIQVNSVKECVNYLRNQE